MSIGPRIREGHRGLRYPVQFSSVNTSNMASARLQRTCETAQNDSSRLFDQDFCIRSTRTYILFRNLLPTDRRSTHCNRRSPNTADSSLMLIAQSVDGWVPHCTRPNLHQEEASLHLCLFR